MIKPSNVIPINPPPVELKCSFCGKSKSKVRILIEASNGARICNECVIQAKKRIAQ